jgi:hypothetical protein
MVTRDHEKIVGVKSTTKKIVSVEFLMNVLATMGEKYTEKSLESKNCSNLKVNHHYDVKILSKEFLESTF